MLELRKDPVTGRWVIISTERAMRPIKVRDHYEQEEDEVCPFCPGNEKLSPHEIFAFRDHGSQRDGPGWHLRVVPNRFPALRVEGELIKEGVGMYDRMSGIGAHEVIIETPHHDKNLFDLPVSVTERLLWAFRERILDLARDERLKYVLVFKNSGVRAGATITHPHCQLIALPVVCREVEDEMRGAKGYFNFKDRCVFCDMIRQELQARSRLVAYNGLHVAFCPFSPRFPFETWILPTSHSSRFELINGEEIHSAAEVLRSVLKKISSVVEEPAFNFYLHNSPLRTASMLHYHWHIEVLPVTSGIAGFERGSAFYINPVPPEEAAEAMRRIEVRAEENKEI